MDRILENDQQEQQADAFDRRIGVDRQALQRTIKAAVAFTAQAPPDASLRPWRPWGARNLTGRIRALAQNPRNPSSIYAGSAMGGVFHSGDGGDTWQAVGGPGDSFPVGALAVAPGNPNILYVGTGEPAIIHRAGGSPAALVGQEIRPRGLGFYRYDAAAGTFANEVDALASSPGAAGSAGSYAAIAVDPQNADRCWIASHTGLWRREPAAPRFRREPVPAPPPDAPRLGACVSDVVLVDDWNPEQPSTYRLFAGVAGVGVFRGVFTPSPAPTTTWDPVLTGGLPAPASAAAATFDRIRIAVCRSFPHHVYAVFASAADQSIRSVFHSSDGGDHWTACAVPANLGTQAWHSLCLAVHPDNPSAVVIGSTNLARSLDGGATWQTIIDARNFAGLDRAQHGGQHAVLFDRREPNRLWVANDGGISSAPDILNANPLTEQTWRQRSHGLCAAQFHDITTHPDYPFMMGGGLQDLGTFMTFGGPTWVPVGDADGGQMCFEVRNPRQFVAPHRGNTERGLNNLTQSQVVAGSLVDPNPGFYPLVLRASNPDVLHAPDDFFAVQVLEPSAGPASVAGLFVPRVVHHPRDTNNLMAGGHTDVVFSTDGGATYTAGAANGVVGAHDVTALAYGAGPTAVVSDWWIGTSNGAIGRGDGGSLPKTWTDVTPPVPAPGLAGVVVTAIAVHPNNASYVVVATGGHGEERQGRVFLSNNRGANWMDITGGATATVIGGSSSGTASGTPRALPPCPVTSLAFDPTVAASGSQVLYVGTLAGVYVVRNLPRLPAGSPPIAPPQAFNPAWHPFNGPPEAPLPQTLVNDLELVTLPARPGAAADSPESMPRLRLYAAVHGRGIFACDASATYPSGVPHGGPPRRLFIRQHAIEDGLAYPRVPPPVLNAPPAAPNYNAPQLQGDPRRPPIPATLTAPLPPTAFNDYSAVDIRIDNAPFRFFDESVDGVEFDEDLPAKNLVPGRMNAIYVQVHNAGWGRFTQPVDVHLFFARAVAPEGTTDPAPLPDLHDNFWSNFTMEPDLPPPAGALAPGANRWHRLGKKTIPGGGLSANHPAVVRFEWATPASFAGKFVGLLALCTSGEDTLAAQPARLLNLRTLIREERRAAFRLAATDLVAPDIYIRDTVDDSGGLRTPAFAGRSPDIIIVDTPVADPAAVFIDLSDTHEANRIHIGVDQFIYVRVHNRGDVDVTADVEVFWTRLNAAVTAADLHAPAFDAAKWTRVAPPNVAPVTVPAHGSAIATVRWLKTEVPDPDPSPDADNAIGLAAIVSSTAAGEDIAPQPSRVTDAASFWQFFGNMPESDNAAFRVVRYDATPVRAFTFDPPGAVDDLGLPGSPLYLEWHNFISSKMSGEIANLDAFLGPGLSQFYNPAVTPTTSPSVKLTVTWKGFPLKFLRRERDDRRAAWALADVFTLGVERGQDEYVEWFAHKTAGKITRVDFTAEAWDYWEFLGDRGKADPENSKILELYRRFIDPAVQASEIFTGSGGDYEKFNQWNTSRGAMHLTNRSNTLGAEINLAATATVLWKNGTESVTDPLQLIRAGGFGSEVRSSDPRIGWDVNNLARQGYMITLASPVGLLIDSLDDTGFLKPDGTPVGNYWRVLRGFGGGILRATYEVPAAEGFVVGDITIGGQPVEFGGQIAEHVVMKLVGQACRFPGRGAAPEKSTSEAAPGLFGLAPRNSGGALLAGFSRRADTEFA